MTDLKERGCDTLIFFVNGKKVIEKDADPEITLLQYLRSKLRLTGTKLGCSEGGCGACTVMVSKYDRAKKAIFHFSVNACLAPLCSMHGLSVTTVEGIGSTKNGLHPIQERLAKSHGSQCGFCTPGIVMSMYTLLRNNPQPCRADMESAFEGNLCRCTGYRPILDGFKTFTKEFQCGMGDACCKNQNSNSSAACMNGDSGMSSQIVNPSEFTSYDPTQEPIFPSELQLTNKYDTETVVFKNDRVTWVRPKSLEELITFKSQYPQARLVTGNTEVGIEVKFKNMQYPVLISPTHVEEMNDVSVGETGITFGAATTLATVEETLKEEIEKLPEFQVRVFAAIVDMLRWFAGHQVRNVAAIAGNIMTASPISDLNPIFLAANCKLTVQSKAGGKREITMNHEFFTGYRKTIVKPDEVVLSIHIPFTRKNEYFKSYKQAHRRDDDIAIVNAGMRVLFEDDNMTVKELGLAFGGMAPTTVMATNTMQQLVGKKWEDDIVSAACKFLSDDLPLPPGTPGGMEPYRRTLTTSFFFKFYLTVLDNLRLHKANLRSKVPTSFKSAAKDYHRDASKGIQLFEEVWEGQPQDDDVGRPIPHVAAEKQVTGEAVYIDDMPALENELYLGLVLSTKAHAKIISVDPSAALEVPGVHSYVDHKDVPGSNWGWSVAKDEPVFVEEEVTCQGQVVGAIVADNQTIAQRAAKLVKVEYEVLKPIITIEEAIAAESFYQPIRTLKDGDTEQGFNQADHVISGEVRVGGQEHFYLETNATIAVPKGEDGEIEVFSSCQSPKALQSGIASALGVMNNKVVIRVKRMGGGFGGKETRFALLALPVAVAATKVGRPVRCMADRDEDMVMSGTRHPFLSRYKVGFTKEGKIVSLEIDLYSNAGNSFDLSYSVMERALFHMDNTYKIPNIRGTGYVCKTNIPSNTAFRGFGGPQGMFMMESIITDVADQLGLSHDKVRMLNMYKEGDITPFKQKLEMFYLNRCWSELEEKSDYCQRKKEVDLFNSENRWKKRGIVMIPTKFGISFTAFFLNQAGALINVYQDGSVLLAHGGTEMGQGLHTKMIQVCSRSLKIPISKIHISETHTSTVPNASPTAASASSDLNGMAIVVSSSNYIHFSFIIFFHIYYQVEYILIFRLDVIVIIRTLINYQEQFNIYSRNINM